MSEVQKDMKDLLDNILYGLLRSEEEKVRTNYQEKILELIEKKSNEIKEPDDFNIFIVSKLDEILKVFVRELNPEINDSSLYYLYFIYKNYSFIENNLVSIIEEKEGPCCSFDKSRWLIEGYKRHLLEGITPDITMDDECYWKPKFGEAKQWIEYIDSLVKLYHGKPLPYFKTYMELIKINN